MWSKKWYLKRNISCDAHLLNELLVTDVPRDNAIVVSAGKLRKLWDFLSELRSCVWKVTGKDSSESCAIACQNCAVYLVFPSGMTSHSKIAQFNWEGIWRFIHQLIYMHVNPVFTPLPPSRTALLLNSEERLRKASHELRGWHAIKHISVVKGNRQRATSIPDRDTDSSSSLKRSGLLLTHSLPAI